MDNKAFEKWARGQVYNEREDFGKCVRFVLRHLTSGTKAGSEVLTIDTKDPDDDKLTDWRIELEAAATQDASGIGGLQSYVVQSFFEHSKTHVARFTFRVDAGNEDEEGDVNTTEGPTATGLTAQLMRHNEALVRTSILGTQQVVQTLQRTVTRQSEMLEKLFDEKIENLSSIEDLLSKKHERELTTKKQERDDEMRAQLLDSAKLLLPVVVNKLSGKKLLPEPQSEKEAMLAALISQLQPEQFDGILKILTPAQQLAMVELISSMQGEKPQINGAQKEAANGNGTAAPAE